MSAQTYTDRLRGQIFALLKRADITDREPRMSVIREVLHVDATSLTQLTIIQLRGVVDTLEALKRKGDLVKFCQDAVAKHKTPPSDPMVAL